jgi:C1A family cysteine protease
MNKYVCILALVTLTGLIAASEDIHEKILQSFMAGPTKDLFKVYHELFNKEYDLNTEEGIRRYRIFKDNLKYIKDENSKGHSHKLGLTPFADMTNKEYRETMLMDPATIKNHFEDFNDSSSDFLAENEKAGYTPGSVTVDWTHTFPPVGAQGKCGSCWAFATLGAIEGNYFIKTGKRISLSEQQVVSCGQGNCVGGKPENVFKYLINNAAMLDADYPYTSGETGVQGICSYDRTKALNIGLRSHQHFEGSMDEWVEMIKKGPMVTSIDMSGKLMQHLIGGIIEVTSYCKDPNHLVVAVGISSDEKGDIIKIRNSWGARWGDQGFAKIRYNTGNGGCFVTRNGWLPLMK